MTTPRLATLSQKPLPVVPPPPEATAKAVINTSRRDHRPGGRKQTSAQSASGRFSQKLGFFTKSKGDAAYQRSLEFPSVSTFEGPNQEASLLSSDDPSQFWGSLELSSAPRASGSRSQQSHASLATSRGGSSLGRVSGGNRYRRRPGGWPGSRGSSTSRMGTENATRWRGRVEHILDGVSPAADFVLASEMLDLVRSPGRKIPPLLSGVRAAMNEVQVQACSRPGTAPVLDWEGSMWSPEDPFMMDPTLEDVGELLPEPARPSTTPAGSRVSLTKRSSTSSTLSASGPGRGFFSQRNSAISARGSVRPQERPQTLPEPCALAKSCSRQKSREEEMHRQQEEAEAIALLNFRPIVKRKTLSADGPQASQDSRDPRVTRKLSSKASALEDAWNDEVIDERDAPQFNLELTVYDAHALSQRYLLPAGQVIQAWKMFKRYDVQDVGKLSAIDFQLLIRSVLRDRFPRAKDIPEEIISQTVLKGEDVTFLGLLEWLAQNSFSKHLLVSSEQKFIREIARQYGVSLPEVEHVKFNFDRYDTDNSGMISSHEFKGLMHALLGVRDQAALPESRLVSFWREVDSAGTGAVNFKEFIPWYLGYFRHDAQEASGPVEAYYRNIRPVPFPYRSH